MSKQIPELSPATVLNDADEFLIRQVGVDRRITAEKVNQLPKDMQYVSGTQNGNIINDMNAYVDAQTVADYSALIAIHSATPYNAGDSVTITNDRIAGKFTIIISAAHGLTSTTGRIITLDANTYALRNGSEGALQADWYEMSFDGTDPAGNDAALAQAISDLRKNPNPNIIQYISGPTITAYSSGVLEFGLGHYTFSPDVHSITQDMGLKLKGQGSRGMNQAILAPTTISFTGASPAGGFGIQAFGNGARNLTIEDVDICYLDASFTGRLVDLYSSPGADFVRVRIGTYGNSGATRLATASAMVALTYHEGTKFDHCVFDGGVDGIYFDDTRTIAGNGFGGWGLTLIRPIFYDFTGEMIRHEPTRTTAAVSLVNPAFNPINVDCLRAMRMENVNGLTIDGGISTPSTASKASVEWFTFDNVTGHMRGVSIADLSKAGTIGGEFDISNNIIFCTDGFDLTGGVITGRGNEFSQATNGYTLAPTSGLTATLGPDRFKVAVTTSYNIPADSSFLSGMIHYDSNNDASTNRFSTNPSERLSIENVDRQTFTVSATTYAILRQNTGRTHNYTGGSAGTWTLPSAESGLTIKVYKQASQDLTIQRAGSDFITDGTGGTRTSIFSAAADVGGFIVFESVGGTGWRITSLVGTWV